MGMAMDMTALEKAKPFDEAFTAGGARELYAAVNGGGVLMSSDGGAHWRARTTS